jgi:hypothetical protein
MCSRVSNDFSTNRVVDADITLTKTFSHDQLR